MLNDTGRPLVTYAQNREDLYLWALLGHRPNGTYVDVGCHHETEHSVTKLFYEHGWSGIDIDANPKFKPGYEGRTRDRFVLAGIGSAPGQLTFRAYPNHDGLSTFDPVIMAQHEQAGLPYEDVQVTLRTLDDVLAEHDVTRIDFLKIDVEGLEAEVLQGLDLGAVRPTVIVVEASRTEGCDLILLPNGYRREFFDGLNVYYVDEHADAGVTMFHYAERVLQPGFLTAREASLLERLAKERRFETRATHTWRAVRDKAARTWRSARARVRKSVRRRARR